MIDRLSRGWLSASSLEMCITSALLFVLHSFFFFFILASISGVRPFLLPLSYTIDGEALASPLLSSLGPQSEKWRQFLFIQSKYFNNSHIIYRLKMIKINLRYVQYLENICNSPCFLSYIFQWQSGCIPLSNSLYFSKELEVHTISLSKQILGQSGHSTNWHSTFSFLNRQILQRNSSVGY